VNGTTNKGSPKNEKTNDRKVKENNESEKDDDYAQELEAFEKLRQQYNTLKSNSHSHPSSPALQPISTHVQPTTMVPPLSLAYSSQPTYLLPSNSSMPLQYTSNPLQYTLVPQLVGLPQSGMAPYMQYPYYHQVAQPSTISVDQLRPSPTRRYNIN